jgi:hypothetical protein
MKIAKVLIFFLVVSLFLVSGCTESDGSIESSPSTDNNVAIGEQGILFVDDLDEILVAVDEDALNDLTDASVAQDSIGYEKVYLEGRAFFVDSGTQVQVIDVSWATREVRILSGSHNGESGWVPYEWVVAE